MSSKRTLTAIMACVLMCSADPGVEAQARNNGTVVVTVPRNGANVGREVVVKGTARLANGEFLWLVARRIDFAPLWFLQKPVIVNPSSEAWQSTAAIGEARDSNWDFEIAAITVNKAAHDELMAKWSTAMQSGVWLPVQIPDTTTPPRVLKVHKTSHR
jgi:hypothetical protein